MTLTTPLAAPNPAQGAYGLRPEDLRDAYFPGAKPEVLKGEPTQTIALIEAYNDLEAETDLKTYGQAFKSKLPTLTTCSSPSAVEPDASRRSTRKARRKRMNCPFLRLREKKKRRESFVKKDRQNQNWNQKNQSLNP